MRPQEWLAVKLAVTIICLFIAAANAFEIMDSLAPPSSVGFFSHPEPAGHGLRLAFLVGCVILIVLSWLVLPSCRTRTGVEDAYHRDP